MTTVMGCKTLVLSSDWRPINVLPVLMAIKKVFSGRAKCLDPESYRIYDYEDWLTEWSDVVKVAQYAKDRVISLAGTNLVLPEVIVCTDYHGLGFKANPQRSPKFSRRNLVLRDQSTCQFCGKKFPVRELTMDHIIPKSKGGKAIWSNIVCACVSCNNRKADKSLKDSGMKLIRRPVAPTHNDLRLDPTDRIRMQITSPAPKTWEAFLGATFNTMYWNTSLKDD